MTLEDDKWLAYQGFAFPVFPKTSFNLWGQ